MDNYEDFRRQKKSGFKSARKKLKIISDLAIARNKIAALSETGFNLTGGLEVRDDFYSKHMMRVLTNDVKLSYVMFWSNKPGEYFVPLPDHSVHQDFMEFIKRPEVLLDFPNFHTIGWDRLF